MILGRRRSQCPVMKDKLMPPPDLHTLTRAVVGQSLGLADLDALLAQVEVDMDTVREDQDGVWVGSIGYERFPDVDAFAAHLAAAGVECLVDVRELPISRRRGYAKTALSEALHAAGIEYEHRRGLGNPKPIRDLYKSGEVDAGRHLYREHLRGHPEQIGELQALLEEKRCALMCVEHEQGICHRDEIFAALGERPGLEMAVSALAEL